MKYFYAALAVLMVIAPPAFAQATKFIKPVTAPPDELSTRAMSHGSKNARAQANFGMSSPPSYSVYDSAGTIIGADPDPNVRMRLRIEHDEQF